MIRNANGAGTGARWWLVLALLVIPASLTGQDPLGRPAQERTQERAQELRALAESARERAQEMRTRMLRLGQAELGLVLGEAVDLNGGTGLRVIQVLPDRPAQRAGIQEGDLLLSVAGHALTGGEPGEVSRRMMDVEPGDTVPVLVRRAGEDRTFHVVAGRRGAVVLGPGFRIRAEGMPEGIEVWPGEMIRQQLEGSLAQLRRHRMDLVAMNPGLGRYFGVEDGVLVVSVEEESRLGLQPGDVMVSIGGRAVRDPGHARSILSSYRPDEVVEIVVVRDRQRTTVRGSTGPSR
jgi:S1-C subfamily serine protease